jgi:pyruvate formate lyase activating enzyme
LAQKKYIGDGKIMKIGGFQKFSLIDYPGKTAAIIFTQGCNMFCPYCHNPQLVYPNLYETAVNEDKIFSFLEQRRGLLNGVVITGGEPLVQAGLPDFIRKIKKETGYCVKLDTNGTSPRALENLIKEKLIDFIAMDIKSPLEKYALFFKGDLNCIKESVSVIQNSGLPHLFRTTYDTDILNETDIETIKSYAANSKHIVQECVKL